MEADAALDLAREWLASLNDGERERFRKTLAPGAVCVRHPEGQRDEGADQVEEACFRWRGQFIGLQGEIQAAFGDADHAALEVVWSGLARQTGSGVRFRACLLFALDDGRIARIANYYDRLSFREQLRG